MLQIAAWKRALVWAICLGGLFFAFPNAFYTRVETHNQAVAKIEKSGATPELQAQAEEWPSWLPSDVVNLGLDLRGGAHLLAEVHVEDVYKTRMDSYWTEIRDALVKIRDQVGFVEQVPDPTPGEIKVRISKPEGMQAALAAVRALAQPVVSLTSAGAKTFDASASGDVITVALSAAEKAAIDNRTMEQSLRIVERRVNAAGTREPTIQREGARRILIEVPGLGSAAQLKALIGTTARLTFHEVAGQTSDKNANPGPGNILVQSQNNPNDYYILKSTPVLSGDDLVDANPTFDQNGQPAVSFRFGPTGARIFGQFTSSHVGQLFAIVLDNKVITAPQIREPITGGSGQITGNFTVESSTQLAILLRAGALPASMTFLEERTIGPQLGADSINAGKTASIVAGIAVLVFMVASYGLFGVFANIALLFNMALILAVLSLLGATLTLPGIAGIVLTIGMAVDANVLVYERIREELRTAKGPARAIELGYERALSAIVDANITTFITALILYFMGTGPVRGFAVTLGIGIVTSVFTAIWVTRLLVVMWFDRKRPRTIVV